MNDLSSSQLYDSRTLRAIVDAMESLTTPLPRAVIFTITFVWWIAMSLWEGRGRQAKHTIPEGRRNDLLCFFGIGAAALAAISFKGLFPSIMLCDSSILYWVGIILVWVGALLRHWAVVTLGQYHVMTIYTEPRQPVITSGPYKYVRHPSYLGALVAVLGIALALNSLLGSIPLAIVAVVALVQRVHIEDNYLLKHLGSGYRRYADQTHRLIPFVW
jgi:protein-S-isoprenylcysteine O-methyltransferase Ste14